MREGWIGQVEYAYILLGWLLLLLRGMRGVVSASGAVDIYISLASPNGRVNGHQVDFVIYMLLGDYPACESGGF